MTAQQDAAWIEMENACPAGNCCPPKCHGPDRQKTCCVQPPPPTPTSTPTPRPTPTTIPTLPPVGKKDKCSPGEKEYCLALEIAAMDQKSKCQEEKNNFFIRACYHSELCLPKCTGQLPESAVVPGNIEGIIRLGVVTDRSDPVYPCVTCLAGCLSIGDTANWRLDPLVQDELAAIRESCSAIDLDCPKQCRYQTSTGGTLNCCNPFAP